MIIVASKSLMEYISSPVSAHADAKESRDPRPFAHIHPLGSCN